MTETYEVRAIWEGLLLESRTFHSRAQADTAFDVTLARHLRDLPRSRNTAVQLIDPATDDVLSEVYVVELPS